MVQELTVPSLGPAVHWTEEPAGSGTVHDSA